MLRLITSVVIGWSAVLSLSSAQNATPRTTPNDNAIQRFISAPIYHNAQWGILIADASSGEPLFQLNSDKLFAPASTTKLFSGAAALVALGPSFRFVTPVYRQTARDSNGLQSDTLVLRAMGDPNLSGRIDRDGHLKYTAEDHIYANFSNRATLTDTDPLSTLDELAAQVASAQIHQVKDVLVDDRLFEPAEGSGSGPTRITPIVVNDDVFDILATPATEVGGQANVQIRPSTSYAQWDVAVKTVEATDRTEVDISEIPGRHYTVRGQISRGRAPLLRVAAVSDPTEFARTLFIERLLAHGVMVDASRYASQDAVQLPDPGEYQRMKPVAQHTSPPFAEALKVILKTSHNLGAGMLPSIMAAQKGERTPAAGMLREGEVLKSLGVPIETISFGGGVGGSRADFTTPRATVTLLQAMSRRQDFSTYEDALPILGVDGTLFDAVGPDSPARGKAMGKTGTLVWENLLTGKFLLLSKALAGYMTASSGRKLLIALFVNDVSIDRLPDDAEEQGKALGHLCEIIYQNY